MKKILLFLCCSVCIYTNAQPTRFTKNLNAYTGTWEFQSDTCTFRLYLKKGKSYSCKGCPLANEMVFGGHYIERNGVVLTDLEAATKIATDQTRTENGMTIVAANQEPEEHLVNPNVLTFVFGDRLKDKKGSGELTLIPGSPMQLRWHIQNRSEKIFLRIVGDPDPIIHQGWTVPTDVILTKIADGDPDPITPPGKPGLGGKDPDIITP